MNLICYLGDDERVDIRPSRHRRKWMDQMPYSYRCLPLSIANAHGWEAHCPLSFEAEWNGGCKVDDIQIRFEDGGSSSLAVESRFGGGVLTFNLRVIIRTPPGYDLWVSGPVNDFKDGIQALSAVIETYWMPYTFTMNWKFTRPNCKIRFEKGEPFCFFFPIRHRLLEQCNPSFRKMSDCPDLERQFKTAWGERSLLAVLERAGKNITERDRKRLRWQGWYTRGEMPDGADVMEHQKRVVLKPFTDNS